MGNFTISSIFIFFSLFKNIFIKNILKSLKVKLTDVTFYHIITDRHEKGTGAVT